IICSAMLVFRSSIIALNSVSEICNIPLTIIGAAKGKTVIENIFIKSCFGLMGFMIPSAISLSIWATNGVGLGRFALFKKDITNSGLLFISWIMNGGK